MHDESAHLPETLNNVTAKASLHKFARSRARVFVTGQCVKYQKIVLTQMVIWITFILETKAPRSMHIVQSTGLYFGYLSAFAFYIALNGKMY